jgi:hypothetical protein
MVFNGDDVILNELIIIAYCFDPNHMALNGRCLLEKGERSNQKLSTERDRAVEPAPSRNPSIVASQSVRHCAN